MPGWVQYRAGESGATPGRNAGLDGDAMRQAIAETEQIAQEAIDARIALEEQLRKVRLRNRVLSVLCVVLALLAAYGLAT